MSYSFGIKAADKAAAKEAVAAKFDSEVVAHQPVHVRDRAAVLANVGSVIDLLADDDTKDIMVSVNGYVSWGATVDGTEQFSTVSVSATASYATRAA
jgi:hypothetical protein